MCTGAQGGGLLALFDVDKTLFMTSDPLVGLAITLVILKITWDSWRLVSTTDPGEQVD